MATYFPNSLTYSIFEVLNRRYNVDVDIVFHVVSKETLTKYNITGPRWPIKRSENFSRTRTVIFLRHHSRWFFDGISKKNTSPLHLNWAKRILTRLVPKGTRLSSKPRIKESNPVNNTTRIAILTSIISFLLSQNKLHQIFDSHIVTIDYFDYICLPWTFMSSG